MKKCVIVGGGILGASTAYYLAKAGCSVTIIDRKDEGQATEAAAGIICPWVSKRRNQKWYTLARNGAKLYPNLIEELNQLGEKATGYKKTGSLHLNKDMNALKEMQNRTLQKRIDAPEIGEVTLLHHNQAKKMFPPLTEGYHALYVSGSARLNGSALRDSLINAAKKYGATYIIGDAKVLVKNRKVVSVNVQNEKYIADEYILTSGAWQNDLVSQLDVPIEIKAQKAQILQLKTNSFKTDDFPVIMQPNTQYLLPMSNGNFLIGTTHENNMNFNMAVTSNGMFEILSKIKDIAPELLNSDFIKAKVGFRPVVKDSLPFFGYLPNHKNVLIANGLGSSGLTTAPYIASILKKLVLNQQIEIDLSLYEVRQNTIN